MKQISLMIETMVTNFYNDTSVPYAVRAALAEAFTKARAEVQGIEDREANAARKVKIVTDN